MSAPIEVEFRARVKRWVMQFESDVDRGTFPDGYPDAEAMFVDFLVTTRIVSIDTIIELTDEPLRQEHEFAL